MRITTAKSLLGSALLLLAAFATPVATSQTNTGTIVGTVTDDTGAVIPPSGWTGRCCRR